MESCLKELLEALTAYAAENCYEASGVFPRYMQQFPKY